MEVSVNSIIFYFCLSVFVILVLSILGYYFVKAVTLAYYEVKLFYYKKLKENNNGEQIGSD